MYEAFDILVFLHMVNVLVQ